MKPWTWITKRVN